MLSPPVSTGCECGLIALHRDTRGQGTVEYALVLFALLAIIIACGALWRALESGSFVEHAAQSASHNLASASSAPIADVLLY